MGSRKKNAAGGRAVALNVVEPYDFPLSLRVVRSFQPAAPETDDRLRLAARVGGKPAWIEIRQGPGLKGRLEAVSTPRSDNRRLRSLVEWTLNAGLDLAPFYRLAAKDRGLAPLVRKLRGLKPMRPASLFEMAVVAVTEQQISMAAAAKMRSRLVLKFGERAGGLLVFPEPEALAKASLEELRACGLSHAKARYIHELSVKITSRELDLDGLKTMSDDDAREMIMSLTGFGRWSADYILVRGLARPDSVPVDDLGVRSVVGEYLGSGQRLSPLGVARKLERFRPYRGLLAFYLLADHRLGVLAKVSAGV